MVAYKKLTVYTFLHWIPQFTIFVKDLSTKDMNKIKYIFTGSIDFVFTNTFQFNKPKYGIYNNITYRYSGKSEKQVIVNFPTISGAENFILFTMAIYF